MPLLKQKRTWNQDTSQGSDWFGTHELPGYNSRERAALDLKVYFCNPAKWIMDMVRLNVVERSKFPQFSKPGEGTLTSLSDTGIT